MKITMPDGSAAEVTVEEYAQLVGLGIVSAAPKQNQAELLRAAFASAPTAEIPVNGSVMGDQDWKEEQAREQHLTPAVMSKKVEGPPVAYVTQTQMMVIEVLRHFPEGLKTKEIGEKLRWEHGKATRITTHMERTLLGYARPIIERVPNHYIYRLTDFGKCAAYKIDGQPSRKREMIR